MRKKAIKQFRRVTQDHNIELADTADMGGQDCVVYVENGAKHSNVKNPLQPMFKEYTTFNINHQPDVYQDLMKPLKKKYCNRYDLVISFDTIEHVRQPFIFCKSMVDAARPGGLVFLSTVFVWPYHGEVDYFRFSPEGLRSCFADLPVKCIASG